MAALSLECCICHLQLRNMEEVQEHAQVTGHTDIRESKDPVLNLICKSCGKPCRSKTECDLHSKRTGHTDFEDKTLETAKPITLEGKMEATSGGTIDLAAEITAEDSGTGTEMVVPEVNKQLLEEMEGMGFPTVRAIRALYFSGSSSLEGAVNWIVEHEADPDIDEMPMISANKPARQPLTPEEAKEKLQELRERARKKKEEAEKQMEKEKEKERVRIGKELLLAKRIEEENERKRMVQLRQAEKEEEKRAREKIRQKIEEDKAERRRKLGLPAESTTQSSPVVEEKKSHLPTRPATKAERMRECLRTLKQAHKDDDAKVKRAFQTLLTYIGNVVRSPDEEKYRKIRMSNPAFQERIGSLTGGVQFLELCGFEEQDGEMLILARERVDANVLNVAGAELNSAINNPYFGIL